MKVWGIPEGGLKESIAEPLVDLRAHERKVTLLRFHPTAANVLASVSADGMIKLWDVEGGQEGGQCHVHQQLVQDVQWDYRGNTFATTCKDKVLRVLDGRTGRLGLERKDAHEGSKSSKCVFLGDREMLLTVGFTKQSRRQVRGLNGGWNHERARPGFSVPFSETRFLAEFFFSFFLLVCQLKIWDLKNLKQEVKTLDIDQAAGAIMPFFDSDTNLLYLAGKVRFLRPSLFSPSQYCRMPSRLSTKWLYARQTPLHSYLFFQLIRATAISATTRLSRKPPLSFPSPSIAPLPPPKAVAWCPSAGWTCSAARPLVSSSSPLAAWNPSPSSSPARAAFSRTTFSPPQWLAFPRIQHRNGGQALIRHPCSCLWTPRSGRAGRRVGRTWGGEG